MVVYICRACDRGRDLDYVSERGDAVECPHCGERTYDWQFINTPGLRTLAHNIATAGGLYEAFERGRRRTLEEEFSTGLFEEWQPW